ncbi:hypothetical protein FCM35_KLT14772 [Carex littledalei]|uniref:Uncharacterized protein n=1 Tax=Carex littledalei TaxID=544730 RepID=A0A833VED3_9POAL|nr:hypothetical protein FCM35_KLT14772 [Carex littledalei]
MISDRKRKWELECGSWERSSERVGKRARCEGEVGDEGEERRWKRIATVRFFERSVVERGRTLWTTLAGLMFWTDFGTSGYRPYIPLNSYSTIDFVKEIAEMEKSRRINLQCMAHDFG